MNLRLALALGAASLLIPAFAQTPAGDAAWIGVRDLPGVDMSKLTAAQKDQALKALRKENCTCGCQMRIAQCRVVDPPCSDSRALSAMVVAAVAAGKGPAAIHDELIHSRLARLRADQNRVLGDPQNIPVAGAPVRGPASARITIVEFSDFECPYCTQAVAAIDALMKAYPHSLKLIYKEFPLEMHPHARLAAQAALAANEQGKFWEMHDKLFANSRQLSRERIFVLAKETGLDMARFQKDVDSGKFNAVVDRDIHDGEEAGVEGTPTLFIDGKHYNGPVSEAVLKPILDQELKQGGTLAAR